MKLFFDTFETLEHWALTPALTVDVVRCEDPGCRAVHAYMLNLQWLARGICLGVDLN